MRCTSCGYEVGNAKFCSNCGAPVIALEESVQETPVQETPAQETPVQENADQDMHTDFSEDNTVASDEIITENESEITSEPTVAPEPDNIAEETAMSNYDNTLPQSESNNAMNSSAYSNNQDNQNPYIVENGKPQKSKLLAGLLGIFLGGFGVHNFYLGYMTKAIIQLSVSVICILLSCCTVGISLIGWAGISIWGLVEGILILAGSIKVDGNGNSLSD